MTSLTISVDEEVIRRARIRATEQGTSVKALVGVYLESLAGEANSRTQAIHEIFAIADRNPSRRGGRAWSRNELHDR